jgi:hypothetical protein
MLWSGLLGEIVLVIVFRTRTTNTNNETWRLASEIFLSSLHTEFFINLLV